VGNATGAQYVVRFGSTGAEAVEMAIAHAVLEREERWRRLRRDLQRTFGADSPQRVAEIIASNERLLRERPRILALRGSFHGHSLGARAALSSEKKRLPFASLLGVDPVFLEPDGSTDLDAVVSDAWLPFRTLERHGHSIVERSFPFSRIIAAIAEPFLGEGGVVEVAPALLEALSRQPFPLILDEIQTGLGRTGTFLASGGVRAGYYLLSKALGGGLVKISALLVERSRYVPRFEETYSSTFAGDALSCAVAGRVLDVVASEDVPGRARDRGAVVRAALEGLRKAYPDVIRQVRGRGLLLGVELETRATLGGFVLRAAVDREIYGILAAAYLLNRHGVRVLPTLSAPNVLRVEPSAWVDDAAVAALRDGLAGFCQAVRDRRVDELLSFLVAEDLADASMAELDRDLPRMPGDVEPAAPGAARVAFLSHFVHPERELAMVEPSLGRLPITARRALFHRFTSLLEMKPVVVFARNLFGGRLHFTSIAIPADVAQLQELHRMGYRRQETERIQEAVDLAARLGCSVVSLGAYTSILTRDGTALAAPPGVRLTSGNSFTVAVGARRILEACRRAGLDPQAPGTRLAIVGAAGNIGRGLTHRLVARPGGFRQVILVGRSAERLQKLRQEVLDLRPGISVDVEVEVTALRRANVIAVATNASEPLIHPRHLGTDRPVILVDVSVPSAIAPEVRRMAGVKVMPLSGTVLLPQDPGFVISSHTVPGTTFACAAEAMLLGLEPAATSGLALTGAIRPRSAEVLDGLALDLGLLGGLGEDLDRTWGDLAVPQDLDLVD
jgi:acetylornithine/succinyldiaminopimelate/putrescine aminotransferase/predicted amino acid dehydrogenase